MIAASRDSRELLFRDSARSINRAKISLMEASGDGGFLVEMVVFRQVQASRRHNTLRHVCVVIGFLLIPSWRAQTRNV